ncbi:sacsin-like [Eriocheir sinensis]|uniref:sacsin-like n=1 Tax=Eriocheir sinensis TaxID=95602 RepID=UPI0021C68FC1|nr:sacsin-like [Eriocheir sinensis]
MNTDRLPRELVVERAESVAGVECSQCACDRVRELLLYMSGLMDAEQEELGHELRSVPFLPVMPKPEGWSIAWHGESPGDREAQSCSQHMDSVPESLVFDCPSALFFPKFKPLVGSCHLLLDHAFEDAPQGVLQRLGVITCALDLPLRSVMEQLCVFSAAPLQKENECMCHTVYEHLEDLILHVRRGKTLNSGNLDALGKLKEKKILVTKYGFKEPKLFALFSEVDCAPDLFSVRTEGLEKYQHLMDTLGIKSHFDYKTVMEVIQEKRETFGSDRLSSNEVSRVSRLLTVLFQVKQSDQQLTQDLHLPDSNGYLHPTNLLCFDDGAKLSSGQFLCLHPRITVSRDMLDWLGIKSKTRKRLQESSNRVPFGQNEPLTTRLRNILEGYPCDLAIIKELLQNADDAGATEVAFIKDFRHLPNEKLFDPKMAPLQGPALSVFNNRGFTEQDLRSIQNLGNSSKKEDPATTGQYGIGFNAVYHLTDAPSFLTKGPQVPDGEALCMFDPHCWYDPAASPQFPGVQFVNLSDLREDHPDSFIGYLESELPEEGTVFRLPLRTIRDSLIAPQETMTEEKVKEMLKEFQRGMPQCLLFLRNVRKISIKEVQRNGTFREEYWVEASVSEESHLPALDPCSLGMVRTSYTMTIRESQGSSSQWLVAQQQGVEGKNSLPRQVQDAFTNKTLNLLPHGGVAIPFATVAPGNDCCSTSCYLPLPVRSGLPFSINGHFALNPSRHNLWTGIADAKSLWNEWLIREVLVPVAVHAVEQFRALMFDGEGYMTENTCKKETRVFHSVLPLASNATSEQWKYFIKEFYAEVRKNEFPFFDVFIPESDLSSAMKEASRVGRKGQLKWCAFHASGDSFPVHFSVISEQGKDHLSILADVFRRLGMKLSSEEMFQRLREADPHFECPHFTHKTALTFLKSCNTGGPDCCQPKVGSKVADTPFLKPNNVKSVLEYITKAEEFSLSSVDNLPLLLTNDGVLRCFSVQRPVFLSTFCGLLPAFGEEFTSCVLVQEVEANKTSFKDVVKEFTPADFVQRLPDDPGASGCVAKAKAPLTTAKHKRWLEDVWKFVVHYIKKHDEDSTLAQDRNKQYILTHLGKWAFYPMKEGNQEFVIPIRDAWQVLDVGDYAGGGSVFSKLPVPFPSCSRSGQEGKPHIPCRLKLEASLKEPVTVLELLYFHRESVNSFFIKDSRQGGSRQVLTALEILEYLGQHCSRCQMSKDKIRSLQIFCDVSGEHSDLVGRNLIVLKDSCLSLHELESLCDKLRLFVTCQATCTLHVTKLYTYIQPNCIVEETDWYAKYILPNISLLTEEKRMFFLDNLRSKLPNISREMEWSEGQQRVVSALKKCPFIELNGTLRTANNIYDPSNPVFAVMGESNLPEAWREKKWQHLLHLAGMVCKVTPEKFIQFASLFPGDEHVRRKSEVLCEYLGDHLADFDLVMSQILDKEFLVPEKCIELATLLAHHQTRSGLLAFSEGVDPGRGLAHVIWSTRSLLPVYAISVARKLQAQYSSKVKMHTPPVEDILEHIEKLCSSLQKEPEKEPDLVKQVMESIYEYLSKNEDGAFGTLKDRDIPVVHIPEHRVFVPASWVVESLEEEILPHLYKAPTFYGKFFGTLRRLGMQTEASSDLYAKVLSKIHQDSGQERLHPEEAKQMKMAMMGLVKRPPQLKDLSTSELYLPARDETLRSSVEMFVADNMDMFYAIQETFKEPVFVGFEALQISFKESSLVKLLPQRLKPKFLSEVLQECLAHEDLEDVVTNFLSEVKELLQAEELKTGVLRVIDHHRLGQGSGLSQDEKQEIVALLGRVRVRQVRKLTTNVMMHGHGVGQRVKQFFFQMEGQGDQQTLTVYLCEKFPPRLLSGCLHKAYSLLLHKWSIERMMELGNIFGCVGKLHFIHSTLDQSDIKAYSAHSPARCLYMCDVGNYLEERFLPLLDNGFCSFSKGEIVCMKKYLCPCEGERRTEEDEDDIFVIVQVVRLVERHASCQMLDTYEVNTSQGQPCVVTVRASLLYRFVRREVRDVVLLQASAAEEENLNESEIFSKLRKQVKICGVEDEHLRRHVIRRLSLKWHPDKNPGREDLCTRLFQYIQSLLGRLERGEHIPDEEDEAQAPRTRPSNAYSSFFHPPRWHYQNFSSDGWWMPSGSSQERVPKSDLPEARRWRRQAHCDLKAAEGMMSLDEEEWTSWVVFMCYQAAEKMLLATLYSKDMEEACRQKGHGPLSRTLTTLAQLLKDSHINRLADRIQNVAGGFLGPLYPTFARCPRDGYTSANARRIVTEMSTEAIRSLSEI